METQSASNSNVSDVNPVPHPPISVVLFPDGKKKKESPVYAYNERLVAASADCIWAWLIRADRWHEWYGNAKGMEIDGGGPALGPGTTFHWTTFGVRVHTKIDEFVPNERLSWSGTGLGSTAYHGWVIRPLPSGCLVITEETQQGFVASLGRAFLKSGLSKWHQRWLEGLSNVTSNGFPKSS